MHVPLTPSAGIPTTRAPSINADGVAIATMGYLTIALLKTIMREEPNPTAGPNPTSVEAVAMHYKEGAGLPAPLEPIVTILQDVGNSEEGPFPNGLLRFVVRAYKVKET